MNSPILDVLLNFSQLQNLVRDYEEMVNECFDLINDLLTQNRDLSMQIENGILNKHRRKVHFLKKKLVQKNLMSFFSSVDGLNLRAPQRELVLPAEANKRNQKNVEVLEKQRKTMAFHVQNKNKNFGKVNESLKRKPETDLYDINGGKQDIHLIVKKSKIV